MQIIFSNHINDKKYSSFSTIDDFLSFLMKNKIKVKKLFNKLDTFYVIVDGNHRFNFLLNFLISIDDEIYDDEFDYYFEIVEEKEVSLQEIFLLKKLFIHQQKELNNNPNKLFKKGNIKINLNKKEIDFIYKYIYSDYTEGVGFYIKGLLELNGNKYEVRGKLKGLYYSCCGGPYRKNKEIDFSFSNMETLKKQFQKKYYVKDLNNFLTNFNIKKFYFNLRFVDKNDFEIFEEEDKKTLPEIFIYIVDGIYYCWI